MQFEYSIRPKPNMVFELKGKVALVTGGASGIGLCYVKELLRNEVKGVTLADVDPQLGKTALDQIAKEFGQNKAIFVKTDVTDIRQFEDALKKTIETFRNLDILINNAGILNDEAWEKEVAINVNGTIHGMLLGMDNYLPKYKQGEDALIVNISSIAGIVPSTEYPIYTATKWAVLGLSRSLGHPHHYERTKVRVIAICPGLTNTPMALTRILGGRTYQEPEFLASQVVKLAQTGENGSVWVIDGGEPAYQFIEAEISTMKK